jgi:hypothetical protein
MFTALLVLGGAACSSDGGDDRTGSGASGSGAASGDEASADEGADDESKEPPSAEFCDVLLNEQPTSSAIAAQLQHYEKLSPLAPGWLKDDIDLVIERLQAHADDGEVSITISADADAQPALRELFGVGMDCVQD